MTNPLLQKYEELYGKKEEPKKVEYELDPEFVKQIDEVGPIPSQEVIEKLRQLQPNSKVISSISTSPNPPSLVSYDVDSGKDSFLQTAEKVKNRNARVTSVTLNRDAVGGIFSTGRTTITFEVEVWDTP